MTNDADDRFDALLRDAAATYNRPPADGDLPLDAMWRSIEAEAFSTTGTPAASRSQETAKSTEPRKWWRSGWHRSQWLRIAAALVIGVGIGRISLLIGASSSTTRTGIERPIATTTPPTIASTPQSYDPSTSRYLGQAAALLIALPGEANTGKPDRRFLTRANELLVTTRLLLDSPSASEQGLRNLLEDLELVLVQVVRLEHERDRAQRTELELIQQALDQRDVLPRLRNAVSEHGADD
jgi:hypothetical protein